MPPPRLYKYEAFTTRTHQNLKDQVLYFGAPAQFNDPYDCALTPTILPPTEAEVDAFRADLIRAKPEKAAIYERLSQADVANMVHRAVTERLAAMVEEYVQTMGVSCFSEIPNDLLMWSHYGGRYRGICLEFDTAHDPFHRALRVEYTDRLPVLAVSSVLSGDAGAEAVLSLFRTKSSSWRYEREWRILHLKAGTQFVYKAPSLTGVYFGPDIDFTSVEIVCLILRGQNPDVKFYSGSRGRAEFKVDFEEFSYTDFLSAQARGIKAEGDRSQVWPVRPSKG